ncbi:unnamed protein product, partial [Amoebophrya sp. A25]|eukprot:GSA25T00019645001.1
MSSPFLSRSPHSGQKKGAYPMRSGGKVNLPFLPQRQRSITNLLTNKKDTVVRGSPVFDSGDEWRNGRVYKQNNENPPNLLQGSPVNHREQCAGTVTPASEKARSPV